MRARACVVGPGGYRLRQIIGISLTGRILLVRVSGGGGGGRARERVSERFRPPAGPPLHRPAAAAVTPPPVRARDPVPTQTSVPAPAPALRRRPAHD